MAPGLGLAEKYIAAGPDTAQPVDARRSPETTKTAAQSIPARPSTGWLGFRSSRHQGATATKTHHDHKPTQTIASQNDAFRARPAEGLLLTKGVSDNGPAFVQETLRAVSAFDAFTVENDPHDDHEFGAFTVAGESLFWKIDYYDRQLECGSLSQRAGPSPGRRILTIMLAEEF